MPWLSVLRWNSPRLLVVSFAPLRNHRVKSKKLQGFASYSQTSVRSQRLHYLDTQRRLLWLHYKGTLEGYTTDLKCKDSNEATNRKKCNPNWTLSNRRTTKCTIRILKVRIVDGGTEERTIESCSPPTGTTSPRGDKDTKPAIDRITFFEARLARLLLLYLKALWILP